MGEKILPTKSLTCAARISREMYRHRPGIMKRETFIYIFSIYDSHMIRMDTN